MDFKRLIPVASGVYRPLAVRRYVMNTMGGFWPAVQKLPNGRIGVVTRDGDFHIGARGRLVFVTSPDGGESWSHATVISEVGPDDRNPAFGVAADGTLLACFIRADRYVEGNWDPSKDPGGYTAMWMSRSSDSGATWSEAELVDGQGNEQWSYAARTGPEDQHRYASAFNKMLTLPDGTVLMGYAITTSGRPRAAGAAFLMRSHDGGRTWVDCVTMGEGYGEPALCHLGGDRLLVMLRGTLEDATGLWQIDSEDGGYTWTKPRRITADQEHPGDVIRLQDGRLLLTYGRRVPPYGIQGMLSSDDGKTWDTDNKLLLVGDSGDLDCGYPSSVQMDDGTIVTVYYAWSIIGDPRMGVHGGALLYRPEDL
jgi:hypothetical protein